MSESRSVTVNGSGGFLLGLLTIVFVVLKLTGVIAWSWWWVLAPLWIPFVVVLFFGAIFLMVVACRR